MTISQDQLDPWHQRHRPKQASSWRAELGPCRGTARLTGGGCTGSERHARLVAAGLVVPAGGAWHAGRGCAQCRPHCGQVGTSEVCRWQVAEPRIQRTSAARGQTQQLQYASSRCLSFASVTSVSQKES